MKLFLVNALAHSLGFNFFKKQHHAENLFNTIESLILRKQYT
jgi:fatty-acid desaturase